MTIYFYSTIDKFGAFSNFSRHGFQLKGKYWPTSEHYFQAQKFAGSKFEDWVRKSNTPKIAANRGRDRKKPLRRDWEKVKDNIMFEAVLRKFETHSEIAELLLSTGDEKIVENAVSDYYWGCGANGSGKNKLGQILMRVRKILRERQQNKAD